MRNLHGIINGMVEGWFWFSAYGMNGREVEGGMAHLYRIERGTPPAINPQPRDQNDMWRDMMRHPRQNWQPWHLRNTPDFRIRTNDAMCHNVRTKSRAPRFYEATTDDNPNVRDWERRNVRCPNCLNLARMAGLITRDLGPTRREDPWVTQPNRNRYADDYDDNWFNRPDPVTGV